MPVCAVCGADNPPRGRFCLACAAPLPEAPPGAEARKTVTVLFCDVTGSTDLGERLDPEALRRVMFRFFDEMRTVLERHGATVEKFAGDDVMAVFGVPVLHEDDALRAVTAAREMQEALVRLNEELEASWGVTLEIRIGINSGEVVTGDLGTGKTLVTGDTVNTAKRIQQAAEPGDILLGRETHRLVRDAVAAGPLESFSLKGKRQPVSPWRLLGTGAELAPRLEAPLIGRERELALLAHHYERAVAEERCLRVTVLGAAGVGKSRLVRELGQQLLGASIAKGRCLPYGEGITFWPVRDIVRHVARIGSDDSPEEARRKIGQLLADGEEAKRVCGTIASALGLGAEVAPSEEIFWALRHLFERLAERRPLVLVVEDIHWAEPTLLDLLEYLEGWSRGRPILLLCLARPELLELRPSWASSETVMLEPLTEQETQELIVKLVGAGDVGTVARAVWDAAEGNPLFAEEMLRMLIDDGVLTRANGGWAVGELGGRAIPPTINALLSARLDRLDADERAVVQLASVIGRQFVWAGVSELAPEELKPRVGACLQALVRKQMILPDETTVFSEDTFRFAHILVRDAAYQSLPKGQRAQLHERYAGWLERRSGARVVEYEEILGYHLEQAYRASTELGPLDDRGIAVARRAYGLLAGAGQRALVRGDAPAAATLLRRASVVGRAAGEMVGELLVDLGAALRESGDLTGADATLEEAVTTAAAAADRTIEARAAVERAHGRLYRWDGSPAELQRLADEMAALVAADDALGLAKTLTLAGQVDYFRGRMSAAEETFERAFAQAQRAEDRQQARFILSFLARANLYGPRPAPDAITRAEELGRRLSRDHVTEAVAAVTQAQLEAMQGRFEEARTRAARAKALLEELGRSLFAAAAGIDLATVELLAGDAGAAERELRLVVAALERIGETSVLSSAAALLAESLLAQGRDDEAERYVVLAKEMTSEADVYGKVGWRTVQARLSLRRDEAGRAEELAREAVACASTTDVPALRAEALTALGQTLRIASAEEATEAFREATRLWREKGNVVAVRRLEEVAAAA